MCCFWSDSNSYQICVADIVFAEPFEEVTMYGLLCFKRLPLFAAILLVVYVVLLPREPLTQTPTMQAYHRRERVFNDNVCEMKIPFGEMCPRSYRELGGKCNLGKEGFDCPDIRHTGSSSVRCSQLVLTRMLRIFDQIARSNGLKYWLTSGTLLGAVRHRGFIPWDGDADIEMPLEDYIKLFTNHSQEFPRDVFFQNSESDPFLRPGDPAKERPLRHPVVGLYRRTWNPRLRDRKSCVGYCLEYGCKWHDGIMIDVFIAEDTLGDTSGVFPLKEMEFEGFPLYAPNNWKDILESKYGEDFMTIPRVSDMVPDEKSDCLHDCEALRKVTM
ncbi:uncharacterized protein LOC5507006 [Nematostella vectensis]|nr:uncharacterized protein LOC5507006 [Nematostella vectensis]